MNPDSNIDVAVVFPNGQAVVYGHADDLGFRPRLSTKQFANYGLAKQWADDFEAGKRADRDRKGNHDRK